MWQYVFDLMKCMYMCVWKIQVKNIDGHTLPLRRLMYFTKIETRLPERQIFIFFPVVCNLHFNKHFKVSENHTSDSIQAKYNEVFLPYKKERFLIN